MFSRIFWYLYNNCKRAWYALQVEHKGQYSLDRLVMLHQFLEQQKTSTTSTLLDVLVALATPLPCLTIALVSDALPLAPPEEGPRANSMFWARTWLIMTCFTIAVLVPLHHPALTSIPENPSWLLAMSAVIAAIYTGFQFAAAVAIGFPVPFSYMTLNLVWLSLIIAGLWIYMGPQYRNSQIVRLQLKHHGIFAYAVTSLAIVYPLFYYAFLCAGEYTGAQLVLSAVVLPLIKVMEKLLLYRVTCHAPDLQPVFVAFDVEVFNALFVSSCMRSSTSFVVTITLMVTDFLGACVALYGLRNAMLRADEIGTKMGVDVTHAKILDTAVLVVKHYHPDQLTTRPTCHATASCFDHYKTLNVDVDAAHQAERLGIDLIGSPLRLALSMKIIPLKRNAVVPAEFTTSSSSNRLSNIVSGSAKAMEELALCDKRRFVHETCRILRRVEFLLLVEYTEVIVPLVYGKSFLTVASVAHVLTYLLCQLYTLLQSTISRIANISPI
ncbi:unnamed protein product [Phytophthora fragariaefolia]|uniref:Unnamed protein product n=1 Tax=Phytophthora fragariaefolia TaxID=1490495 RepID=A0A9W6UED5_9STRA|nr:unnamed protein product [Phytophthora fragariaefolia]